jgi:uncharacterized protein (UPF0262 family)
MPDDTLAPVRQRADEGRQATKRRGVSFERPQKLHPDQKALALSLMQKGRFISEVARTSNIHPATIIAALTRLRRQIGRYAKSGFMIVRRTARMPQAVDAVMCRRTAARNASTVSGLTS